MRTRKTRALSLLLVTAVAWGCMKKPDLSDDPGVAATPESVENAILSAWGDVDPLTIGLNEVAYTEKRLTIEGMAERVMVQDLKLVNRVDDSSPTARVYNLVQQVAEIDQDNQQQLSTSERSVNVKKTAALATKNASLPLGVNNLKFTLDICFAKEVKCSNLRTWSETVPAPALVAAQDGCQGLTNCQWTKNAVAFDVQITIKDEEAGTTHTSKYLYTVKMSQQAPYLSRLTDYCFQGLFQSQGQNFPATICETIKNFERGTAVTP